jgi:hypothetical protein
MIRLYWKGDKLMNGTRPVPIEVRPDDRWAGMYRVYYRGKISDTVNLTRAKDAAVALVVASLNALQKPRPFSPTCRGGKRKASPTARRRTPSPLSVESASGVPSTLLESQAETVMDDAKLAPETPTRIVISCLSDARSVSGAVS